MYISRSENANFHLEKTRSGPNWLLKRRLYLSNDTFLVYFLKQHAQFFYLAKLTGVNLKHCHHTHTNINSIFVLSVNALQYTKMYIQITNQCPPPNYDYVWAVNKVTLYNYINIVCSLNAPRFVIAGFKRFEFIVTKDYTKNDSGARSANFSCRLTHAFDRGCSSRN